MRRSKQGSTVNIPTFDCHGMTYYDVEDQFENWLLLYSTRLPIEVITGDSNKMKSIVKKYLDKHNFNYTVPYWNNGTIIIN
jgi:hypothetical protein